MREIYVLVMNYLNCVTLAYIFIFTFSQSFKYLAIALSVSRLISEFIFGYSLGMFRVRFASSPARYLYLPSSTSLLSPRQKMRRRKKRKRKRSLSVRSLPRKRFVGWVGRKHLSLVGRLFTDIAVMYFCISTFIIIRMYDLIIIIVSVI